LPEDRPESARPVPTAHRILIHLIRLLVLVVLLAGVYYYAIKPLLRMLGFLT
jgi:hypothetical protein